MCGAPNLAQTSRRSVLLRADRSALASARASRRSALSWADRSALAAFRMVAFSEGTEQRRGIGGDSRNRNPWCTIAPTGGAVVVCVGGLERDVPTGALFGHLVRHAAAAADNQPSLPRNLLPFFSPEKRTKYPKLMFMCPNISRVWTLCASVGSPRHFLY